MERRPFGRPFGEPGYLAACEEWVIDYPAAQASSESLAHYIQEHLGQLPPLASSLGGPLQGALLPEGTNRLAATPIDHPRYKDWLGVCHVCH